ncbi:amidohydrolase family protein [Mycobacterium sp. ITM-2016-00317]|uniref:amidohydrolase family protein n=1 Tax=Mycobacterium sp. ITM-2016-00317 TaxID=2099694 RepID=UPI00287F7751|nr:amidohydrolase family protein [Mycobacterium sp. ITM-2016-00317]WNG87967.1 amidohydrolase family protein [Mycobacterium sp. ITM-2016-00317]
MLIRRATLLDGTATDIRVGDRILEVADGLSARPGEPEYDAAGGTVLPGLHDHHIHLRAAAAALHSVRVGPDEVRGGAELAHVLACATAGPDGWIRAVGYHDAAAGPLDRHVLDELAPPVPVRVQHRSGVQWILNTAALQRIGRADHPDGRLPSADPAWAASLRSAPDLAGLSARLSALGVTGVTDATPDLEDPAELRRGMRQRVRWLAPGKRILHDDALDLDALGEWIADQHARDVPVAVHCVTAAQLVVALAALRSTGTHPRDRIEHAAVVPEASLADLAATGVTVVTQPNFVAERGEQYLADVDPAEHHELWRVASLSRAGVPVALSTDAPFGDLDPWAAMRAAVHRATPAGRVLGGREQVGATTALTMFLGEADRPAVPRRIEPGAQGDLCVLAAAPSALLAELDAGAVAATIIGGEMVYERR